MHVRKITYTDYNGTQRTEEFYFNLNKAEIAKMEMGVDGGYGNMLKRIIEKKSGPEIMDTFNKLILQSYGVKSLDGKRFEKSPELSAAFEQSEAYNVLFCELVTDAQKGAAFVNAILPNELIEQAKSQATMDAITANM